MKKSTYPKYVKVGKIKYTVALVKSVSADPTDRGMCDLADKMILLKQNMPERLMFETFIHEILHAVEAEYGIELKHSTIEQLEEALVQVFKDNFYMFFKR